MIPRYALAVAIGIGFAWCGAAPPGPVAGDVSSFRLLEGHGDSRFAVYHDDERGVTCWETRGPHSEPTLACLPDNAFANGGVPMIAALFVARNGAYWNLQDVDPWDEARDARLYAGPWPVVAHPPCERWGRYWSGGPSARVRRVKGDDGGCFAAAFRAVREYGGVLEHPEGSHAWRAFALNLPPATGGWVSADMHGGWTCRVDQGHFGHRARKATWLYAVGCELQSLPWTRASGVRLDEGWHSTVARREARARGVAPLKRLSAAERIGTPPAFRDLLLYMARSVPARRAA